MKILAVVFVIGLCYLSGVLSSCSKNRLFVSVDSVPLNKPQFHFFNSLVYADKLVFSVDGVPRETVGTNKWSDYYPFSNKTNYATVDPSSKLITVNDPVRTLEYTDTLAVQFLPNTTYDLFVKYSAYNTDVGKPKASIKPTLFFVEEETYHPIKGKTKLRFINAAAFLSSSPTQTATMTYTPNSGTGTRGSLTASRASGYALSSPGDKTISAAIGGVSFNFKPVALEDQRAYSFILTGDYLNFLRDKEGPLRMFQVEEGNPQGTKELELKSVSFPSNDANAQVRVQHAACNLPSSYVNRYNGIYVYVNEVRIGGQIDLDPTRFSYWPLADNGAGGVLPDFLFGVTDNILRWQGSTPRNISPQNAVVTVQPVNRFDPLYASRNYAFERGKSYTLLLSPTDFPNQTALKILENDLQPKQDGFKLRLVNAMLGASSVDLHVVDAGGDRVILRDVSFGSETDGYVTLPPSPSPQSLYLSAPGSLINLFSGEANSVFKQNFSVPFTAGNSGTLYVEGTLDPADQFTPLIIYRRDATIDQNQTTNDFLVLPSN